MDSGLPIHTKNEDTTEERTANDTTDLEMCGTPCYYGERQTLLLRFFIPAPIPSVPISAASGQDVFLLAIVLGDLHSRVLTL